MAVVRKGKHKGHSGQIHQFANDWVTFLCDDCDQQVIMNPTMLVWDEDELVRLYADQSLGMFWVIWEPAGYGLFKKRVRRV